MTEKISDIVEPHWMSIDTVGSDFDVEVDVNSRPSKFRHRRRRFTGEAYDEWKDGRAPELPLGKSPGAGPY